MRFALLLLAAAPIAAQDSATPAPIGIPHSLAIQRAARVSNVSYHLHYALVPKAAYTQGAELLRFDLSDTSQPLLIDFREGQVDFVKMDLSHDIPIEQSNGHIILQPKYLKKGENLFNIGFTAPIATSEKAITRFEDKDDGSEYLYTLFVPMDAEMAFPCFDQPDLKARFQLTVDAPAAWTVISNTHGDVTVDANGGPTSTNFDETEPISTYLFAFAAGPFQRINPDPALPGLYVRKSRVKQAETEAPAVQHTAAEGIAYLSKYFAQPFPFPKYDMVLIPGFAYGGMEHAGATFLREEGVLFRTAPTATTLFGRETLVLHELTHQWFGDFTTMRWFDDLWLKEGFAQYMAYQALADLHPEQDVWKRFYQSIKPAAYAIDQTQGTTPIYQDIPNLKDAKSAYGAIVYNKAPAVIKQLHFVVGDDAFRHGLQTYLAAHKYGNAEWSDLVHALEKSSNKDLTTWADMWIKHRGMPQFNVSWKCNEKGELDYFTFTQKSVLGTADVWPMAIEAALYYPDGSVYTDRVPFIEARTGEPVFGFETAPSCPAYMFANHDDHAYGLFPLDEKSRSYLLDHPKVLSANSTAQPINKPVIPSEASAPRAEAQSKDLHGTQRPQARSKLSATTPAALHPTNSSLNRTLLYGALWDSVRNADLAPADYIALALHNLPTETDESLAASLIGHTVTALHRYIVSDALRAALTAQLATLAVDQLQHSPSQDLRINWFRTLPALAENPYARHTIKQILDTKLTIPGVQLRAQDRWGLVTTLIAFNDADATTYLDKEKQRDPSGDGQKYAWIAAAAAPDAATKQLYFDEYLHNPQRPEDWIEGSLGAFNYWNQATLTAPFLEPALDALPQIKRTRKIFFLGGWLNAFIEGQQTAAAAQQVHTYADKPGLDPDLRLKILQSVDELDRTVRIRTKFAQ